MKRAVSISLGSSDRNGEAVLRLLGEDVRIERIGTNGDLREAARLFRELDGTVDALGLGGASLSLAFHGRSYPLRSVLPIVKDVRKTPLVDGAGLRNTLEYRAAQLVDETLGEGVGAKRVLCTVVTDRWGLYAGFRDRGYSCLLGDLIFGLRIPIAIRRERVLAGLMTVLAPIVTRLPFSMLYPLGESQHREVKGYDRFYRWASVIAGDCHYVRSFMPPGLREKIVVTNTTTEDDVAMFRARGVRHLFTTTPVLNGRSFGTNAVEAAMVAVAGKGRPLTDEELTAMISAVGLHPQYRDLA
jgi:hypothetical protein